MAETGTEKREALTPNWAELEKDDNFGSGETTTTTEVVETKEESKTEEVDKNELTEKTEAKIEEKAEAKAEEKVEVKEEKPAETKTENKTEETTTEVPETIELKLEDVKDFQKPAEDGTWKAVGELFEVELKEDNDQAFKEAIEAKYNAKIEEAKKIGIENIYSTLKPETVTALKLMEMGVPQEQAFNPTAEIDSYLKLNDTELLRADLEAREGWDEDRVDLEMEELSKTENAPRLKHEALKIREALTYNKTQINQQREALVNEYTQSKEKVAIEQRNNELTQIKSALDTVSEFMGSKINPEAKSAILQKHNRGDYGNILKDPKSIADYIYFKEFGNTLLEHAKKSSYAKGKNEYAQKMLNIPPKQGEVASKVTVEKQTNQLDNLFKALEKDFGE